MKLPTIRRFKRALRDPKIVAQQINSVYYLARYGQEYPDGVNFLKKDWDNLLILDACRFETFNRLNTIPGKLEKETSKASSTIGFLKSNINGLDLRDTVYVTANPQLVKNKDDIDDNFHHVINVWNDEGWDVDEGTVLPETLVERSLEAAERFPYKKLLIHFIQPHCPFIGPVGKEKIGDSNLDFWPRVREGDKKVSDSDLVEAYEENLKIVLDEIHPLIQTLTGKTVLTSDHGQIIGEHSFPIPYSEYGHPRSTYIKQLIEVPWFVCKFDNRKEIYKMDSDYDLTENKNVQERLKDLGYR